MTVSTITPPELTPWPYGGSGNGGADHLGTGQLGGLQYVSGERIARGHGQHPTYYGHLYTLNVLGTDEIRRVWPFFFSLGKAGGI